MAIIRSALIPLFLVLGLAGAGVSADVKISDGPAVAFTISLPDGWTAAPGKGFTSLNNPKAPHVRLFVVPGDKDPATVAQDFAVVSDRWIKDFAPSQPTKLQVAGADAVRLAGPAVEADDGDLGTAEATVFSVGERTWVLLVHGEADIPPWRSAIDAMLASIAKP